MARTLKSKKEVVRAPKTAKKREAHKNKKVYLLDTNVLVYDPKAIYAFPGGQVALPSIVLEELDRFKREGTDRGRNAREAIRILDGLRAKGSLGEGVTLDNGSVVRVVFLSEEKIFAFPFKLAIEDNEILYDALSLKQDGYDVKFITKDLNVRVKADALGIDTEDYIKEKITVDEFYKGWIKHQVPAVILTDNDPKILRELARFSPTPLLFY